MPEADKYTSTFKALPLLEGIRVDEFWSKVSKTEDDRCWEWKYCIEKMGYGTVSISGSMYKAHRIAYYISSGKDPKGKLICHTCDNRKCVNPSHLFTGTHYDNNMDAWRKGRQVAKRGDENGSRLHPEKVPKGERCGSSKLKEADVRRIRAVCDGNCVSYNKLSTELNVGESTIRRIFKKQSWKHI